MSERLRFVARRLGGAKMVPLCPESGISRKTVYKVVNRYDERGLDARFERSR